MSGFVLHATSRANAAAICQQGLRPGSYWAEPGNVSSYYAQTVRDEGDEAVVLRLPLAAVELLEPKPDWPGLEEPLTHTLRMDEDEIQEAWADTDGSWQACLELIGSLRCAAAVPLELLLAHNPELAALAPGPGRPGVPKP